MAHEITEKTFSKFTQSQGADYAQYRRGYHPTLYTQIIGHHTSTGGQLNTLLDVGCGPGIVARALAPQFNSVIGLDPSDGMIQQARALSSATTEDSNIRFEVSSAEELGLNLEPKPEDGSVDLITAATAAHWFDMPKFWKRAAEVLRQGGTVAIWTIGAAKIHPSTPNAEAIQAEIDSFDEVELAPFKEPGNHIARNLYVDLLLPWTLDPPVAEFEEETYIKKEWGRADAEELLDSSGAAEMNLEMVEKFWGTTSPVVRWRAANPEKVGTREDIGKKFVGAVARLLHEAGVEEGEEKLKATLTGVLMMFKKAL